MEENSELEKTKQEARDIIWWSYVSNLASRTKASTKGAIFGLLGGFVYGTMKGKDKFTTTVVGCFIGFSAGYIYTTFLNKN